MCDLEMTKLCADALGILVEYAYQPEDYVYQKWIIRHANGDSTLYAPLHDDAQAMALVKRLRLHIVCDAEDEVWHCVTREGFYGMHSCLNRAIVQCAAKMQKQRSES